MMVMRISNKLIVAALALCILAVGAGLVGNLGRMGSPSGLGPAAMEQSRDLDVPYWLGERGAQTTIPDGLLINPHARKHSAETLDAWLLYDLLLAQECLASRHYCRRTGAELYLCVAPTGQIGGLIVLGDEILSGYAGSEGYWHGKVREQWGNCDGREYR